MPRPYRPRPYRGTRPSHPASRQPTLGMKEGTGHSPVPSLITSHSRPTLLVLRDLLLRRRGDLFRAELELLHQILQRRARPEALHPDRRPFVADVLVPAEGPLHLDAHAGLHVRREDGVLVRL